MSKEESQQVTRRATRLSSCTNVVETPKTCNLPSLTLNDLVIGEEPLSFDDLISSLPGRRSQIVELIRHLGPLNSQMSPLLVYGGVSTGKTSTTLQIFRHLNRPFVYSSCRTCYNPRILFESILNQLLLHRKSESNGYSSAKRCEKPSDFVNLLRDALVSLIDSLKGNVGKLSSKKSRVRAHGRMVYVIIDSLELVREWDKSSIVLPFLFKLHDILRMPDVGFIFISSSSLDTYYSDTGFVEPIPVFFPDYSEDELRQIFLRNQSNPKLYSSFLDVVLRPFWRTTRRIDELSTAFLPLFKKYCEPLTDLGAAPNEEMKRKLFSHLQPHIAPSLNEIFRIASQPSTEASTNKDKPNRKGTGKKFGISESVDEIDFHMSISTKYLLISAFLASRNPATLDASLFDSTGGSDRKRKRKSSEKSMELKENAEQELMMKGPGTFPLERLLAIFQCITSVADYSLDEDEQGNSGLGGENEGSGLMSDILLQLSSLCNANYISKGASCPLEGSTRYRSTVSEDLALKDVSVSANSGLIRFVPLRIWIQQDLRMLNSAKRSLILYNLHGRRSSFGESVTHVPAT